MNGFNGGEQNREIASKAVFKDLGIPLIGGVLGAMMEWRFDCNMDHAQAIRSHSDKSESGGFDGSEA